MTVSTGCGHEMEQYRDQTSGWSWQDVAIWIFSWSGALFGHLEKSNHALHQYAGKDDLLIARTADKADVYIKVAQQYSCFLISKKGYKIN